MSLTYMGVPPICRHGQHQDKECLRCEIDTLRTQKRRLENWIVFKLCQYQGLTDRVFALSVVQSMIEREPPWSELIQPEVKA